MVTYIAHGRPGSAFEKEATLFVVQWPLFALLVVALLGYPFVHLHSALKNHGGEYLR